jgi:hypothetical protein
MIRITLTAAALLLSSAPALSQSFFPNLYGARFCELRSMGVSESEARAAAMSEAYSRYRQPTMVTYNGKPVSLDVLDAARFIVTNCPELAK